MPNPPGLRVHLFADRVPFSRFARDPVVAPFRRWVLTKSRATYFSYLISHPNASLRTPLSRVGQLTSAVGLKWYRPADYYANSRWRGTWDLDGGGALINQAVHTLDLMLWMFGEVKAVQAMSKTALHAIEAEDTLIAMLEFSNGALGVLQAATSVFPGYPRRLELTGSEGTLIIEQDRLLAADLKNPSADLLKRSEADKNPSSSSPVVSDARGHQAVLEDFLLAIRTNTKPRCDGPEGRRSLTVVQAIYEACRTGKRVSAEVIGNR